MMAVVRGVRCRCPLMTFSILATATLRLAAVPCVLALVLGDQVTAGDTVPHSSQDSASVSERIANGRWDASGPGVALAGATAGTG